MGRQLKRRVQRSYPKTAKPHVCAMCGYAVIKGMDTAMSKVGGKYVHFNQHVCQALRENEELRKAVDKVYGETEYVGTTPDVQAN